MTTPLITDRRTVDASPPESLDRRALHTPLTYLLSASNIMPDGTLWSHAATLGEYIKGSTFQLDAEAARNFVRVFNSGYPQKAPVDYEHESVTKDPRVDSVPWTRRAGEIIEVAAVLGLDDLNLPMRKQVADEAARRAKLGITKPVSPLGVWIRWEPTARALAMVQAREVTEMSIAFHPDFPNNVTGEGQGPTLLSVALTNTPFLDQMHPVAASRGESGHRADTPEHHTERHMPTPQKSAFALAQLLGRSGPFGSDDEAMDASVARITSLNQQVADLEPVKAVVETLSAELGEPDREKIVGNVRQLKAAVAIAEQRAKDERAAKITSEVATFIGANEAKIATKPMREYFTRQLTAELETGSTLADAPTAGVIKSMTVVLGRKAPTDAGVNQSADSELDALTEKYRTEEKLSYDKALEKAERTLSMARR